MTNRRQFLEGGIAASALPLTMSTALVAATPADDERAAPVELYRVLYDTRFPASVAFARRAARNGHAVAATTGDVTRVWYDDLYHRWRMGPAAIAGLTSYGALFCLEQLAIDHRMRVVLRASHSIGAAGCARHAIEGPATVVPAAIDALSGGEWAAAMADVITQCTAERAPRRTAHVTSVAQASAPAAETLYSWIIAPVARAQGVAA